MRLKGKTEPIRPEMEEFVDLIKPLRYLTIREVGDIPEMKKAMPVSQQSLLFKDTHNL